MALTLGGCLVSAMPLTATAQETQVVETHESAASAEPATPESTASAESSDAADLLPTIALERETPPPVADDAPVAPQIEEVVVTATKRSENVREIPASITAISGEELEQRGAQDTADIVKLIPGVNLTSTGDTPARVTIRGISSDIGTGSTTGILFGNVTFSETYVPVVSLDPNPFDMASVEVLKGPQGTLFGAGALNGAVRYVPTPPSFGEFETRYFAQYQSINSGDAAPTYGAAVNLPLFDEELALSVMAFDRTTPGYVDNTVLGKDDVNRTDQQGARALLGWRPGEAWDVLLTTAWQRTLLRDVGITDFEGQPFETANRPRQSPNKTRYSLLDLAVKYDFDWAQLVSDTSYVNRDGKNFFDATSRNTPGSPIPTVGQFYSGESETYGQEFRLVSIDDAESRWKWAGGVFAWQQDLKNTLTVPLAFDFSSAAAVLDVLGQVQPGLASLFGGPGSAPLVLQTVGDVRVREYALFGDLTRKLGDDVELSVGARLYQTKSGGENEQSGAFVVATRGSSPFVLKGGVKERGLNPKASVVWHVTDEVLTYGLVSKGFRVGGVQPGITAPGSANPAPDTFKSDTLWNYELGIRTQWLDNTLRLDLTGFFVDWKDPQSLQLDSTGVSLFIDNVGGVTSKGADVSLQYLFPFGVMFTTSASYAKTETSEDVSISNMEIPKGSPWPLAPKWQTASNLSFLLPVGDWLVGGYATYTFIDKTIPYFGGMDIFDYGQTDLQLSLSNERFKWLPQIALIANNVTGEDALTNGFVSVFGDVSRDYYHITPRSFVLRLMGRFGG